MSDKINLIYECYVKNLVRWNLYCTGDCTSVLNHELVLYWRLYFWIEHWTYIVLEIVLLYWALNLYCTGDCTSVLNLELILYWRLYFCTEPWTFIVLNFELVWYWTLNLLSTQPWNNDSFVLNIEHVLYWSLIVYWSLKLFYTGPWTYIILDFEPKTLLWHIDLHRSGLWTYIVLEIELCLLLEIKLVFFFELIICLNLDVAWYWIGKIVWNKRHWTFTKTKTKISDKCIISRCIMTIFH